MDATTAASSRRRRSSWAWPRPAACTRPSTTSAASSASCSPAARGRRAGPRSRRRCEQMWTPQFAKPGDEDRLRPRLHASASSTASSRVGHGGAIYGFATELAALPDDKLGVVVVASRDVANAVTTPHRRRRPAADARGARQGKPLPKIERDAAGRRRARPRKLAGRYAGKDGKAHRPDRARRPAVRCCRCRGGFRDRAARTRRRPDRRSTARPTGRRSRSRATSSIIGKDTYERVAGREAEAGAGEVARPDRRVRLGPQHAVHPREGRQAARADRVVRPLPAGGGRENVFAFPDRSACTTARSSSSPATRPAGRRRSRRPSVVFERRPIDGEDGETFQIKPLRPRRRAAHARRSPRSRRPRRATSASPTSST